MKYLKTFEEFVNEGKIQTQETITHEVEFDISQEIWEPGYTSEKDFAEHIVAELGLKSGYIDFGRRIAEIKGTITGGHKLEVEQDGEYDMYGGPYNPKMEKPYVRVNGKDIYRMVRKAFDSYGWGKEEVDITRVDIWGHVLNKVR